MTSKLFDKDLEGTTILTLKINDDKEKASKRLQTRKMAKLNGTPRSSTRKNNNNVKRDRSLTTKLDFEQQGAAAVLKGHIERERRDSTIRLQNRIEKRKSSKGSANNDFEFL